MSRGAVEKVESGKGEKAQGRKSPTAVPFILFNVFVERFSSGGIFAILAIFFNQKLLFDLNTATALFHINEFILYFFSIIGAIVADSCLGLYKTILLATLMSSVGAGIISIGSVDALQLPIIPLSLIGLFAIFVASGGMKSNQSVFGGNQFQLPEQEKQLNSYFSIQYFVIKCGLLVGQILIPIMRHDVQCFGMKDCYPLAFGFPAILMFVAFLIFLCGKSICVHMPPTENMLVKVVKCVMIAIKTKFLRRKQISKDHWLDFAEESCGQKLVIDTKTVLNVLSILLTLPIFWALLGQQNSRWVFQATQMNGDLGFFKIKPDQMVMSTTIFIIFLIPIFEKFFYPLIAIIGVKSHFQRMTCGYICSATAFVIAAVIEVKIKENYISMMWLIPQYLLIAIAEIFVWVSNMSFVFQETPQNMKSVMSAIIYFTIAGGSLIVVAVSSSKIFESQMHEYIFYAVLMIMNTIIFTVLSQKYKPVDDRNKA